MQKRNSCVYSTVFSIRWIFFVIVEFHTVAQAQNIYVWPLGYETLSSEVKEYGQPNPGGFVGDVTLAEGPASLGYQTFAFKGTTASYIDLRVPGTTLLNIDCTFMFNFYIETNTEGVLFHYESDNTAAANTITGIDVVFDSFNIVTDFSGTAGTWTGGSASIPNSIPTGQWVEVALQRDISKNNMELFINGAGTTVTGVPSNIAIGVPGTIRIGYSTPSGSALTGRVTCFIIHNGKYNYGDHQSTDIVDCQSSSWTTTAAPCSSDCPFYRGYFSLSEVGKVPLSFIPRLDSASQFSSRRCADLCLANNSCVSFLTQTSSRYCELFSGDHSAYMQASAVTDSKYYVRRDKCCM